MSEGINERKKEKISIIQVKKSRKEHNSNEFLSLMYKFLPKDYIEISKSIKIMNVKIIIVLILLELFIQKQPNNLAIFFKSNFSKKVFHFKRFYSKAREFSILNVKNCYFGNEIYSKIDFNNILSKNKNISKNPNICLNYNEIKVNIKMQFDEKQNLTGNNFIKLNDNNLKSSPYIIYEKRNNLILFLIIYIIIILIISIIDLNRRKEKKINDYLKTKREKEKFRNIKETKGINNKYNNTI